MYSSSARGRSVRSSTSSCGFTGAAATRRSASIIGLLCLRQQLQRLPDAVGKRDTLRQLFDRVHRFLVAVAKGNQGVKYVRGYRRGAVYGYSRRQVGAQLVLQLQEKPLGGLLADARYFGQATRLLHRDGLCELGDGKARQDRECDARADAADLDQLSERATLVFRSETEEQVRVLAHDQMREQGDAVAHVGQVVERAHRHVDFVRDTLHIEQNLRRVLLDQRTGKTSDHRIRPRRTR